MPAQPVIGSTSWGAAQNAFTGTSLDPATGKIKNEALQVASTAPIADAAVANKKYVDDSITANKGNLGTGSELTISSGAITVTEFYHKVDTEGDAASDDLDTINGGSTGDSLVLRQVANARDVTVKDGTGNLKLNSDFVMTNVNRTITLIKISSIWVETSRSANSA
jgi:hypothetical protein